MESRKKKLLNICSFIFFLSLSISFINSSRNSNGDFLRLIFTFDGSSSPAFLLASRIIEQKSSENLMALLLSL